MHVAQVVVLVEELGDRLSVFRCRRPHLDRIGRVGLGAGALRGGDDVVAARLSAAVRADRDLRRQTLPLGTEVQELHVPGDGLEGGKWLRQRPEVASGTRQWQAPVVHRDLDETVARLERHLDLAEVVVRIGVLEREADEALDDGSQSPRIVRGDSDRSRKGGDHRRHQRRRARVAEHRELHARHDTGDRSEPPANAGRRERDPSTLGPPTRPIRTIMTAGWQVTRSLPSLACAREKEVGVRDGKGRSYGNPTRLVGCRVGSPMDRRLDPRLPTTR